MRKSDTQKTLDGTNSFQAREQAKEEEYIKDYATGKSVHSTPEELEARQVFEKRLINEYGYSHDQIDINFMIQKGSIKIGPADIAIFRDNKKIFDNIYLIVETKRMDRNDGIDQLKTYLAPTSAEGGVWFNGRDIEFLRVIRKPPAFTPLFTPWRNIPKKGETWEQIGKHKIMADLKPAPDLKSIFKVIHYHLYTNSNLPRAERLGAEMTRLIFCKIHDELHNGSDLQFKAAADETDGSVAKRIWGIFEKVKGPDYRDVFDSDEKLLLDDASIAYVVNQLQDISLLNTDKDAVGDAFEVFIGPGLRGEKGEFFTPRNVVRMTVQMLDPEPSEKIIDPACGSGGFLIVALEHVWKKTDRHYAHLTKEKLGSIKAEIASKNFFGIDKEFDLAKVSKAYMAIVGDGRGGIFCTDSLVAPKDWSPAMQEKVRFGSFDVLMTNPPFGAKIPVRSKAILNQYDFGYKWKKDKNTGNWIRSNELIDKQVPQVLFIERCLQILRPGGRMGIVLPDGILGNPTDSHIRAFIKSKAKILAVVDMPQETFMPSVGTKTSVLFLQKKNEDATPYPVFMGVAESCGHDRRDNVVYKMDDQGKHTLDTDGNKIIDDDLPKIADAYKRFREENHVLF